MAWMNPLVPVRVQRAAEEDDLRELGGPVTADEPAGAGRLADPGGHLCGAARSRVQTALD